MKILCTGGNGMVGKAIQRELVKNPDGNEWIFTKRGLWTKWIDNFGCEKFLDLRNFENLSEFCDYHFDYSAPDCVVHLAAVCGGVKANQDNNLHFFLENSNINNNIVDFCRTFGVKKFVPILSTCIYPDYSSFHILEGDELHDGLPHPSNEGYAMAKRMLEVQHRLLKKETGATGNILVPNNLFGIYDRFDLERSHVISALIMKAWQAASQGKNEFEVWGHPQSGVSRNFTCADDLAKIIIWEVNRQSLDADVPLIVGDPSEISLFSIVKFLENRYNVKAKWIRNEYTGQLMKPISNENFQREHYRSTGKHFVYSNFWEKFEEVCDWFDA